MYTCSGRRPVSMARNDERYPFGSIKSRTGRLQSPKSRVACIRNFRITVFCRPLSMVGTDLCDLCDRGVKSSKNFWPAGRRGRRGRRASRALVVSGKSGSLELHPGGKSNTLHPVAGSPAVYTAALTRRGGEARILRLDQLEVGAHALVASGVLRATSSPTFLELGRVRRVAIVCTCSTRFAKASCMRASAL